MITTTIHTLKTVEPYFSQVREKKKTFEIRRDDRYYKVGDILKLLKYDARQQKFSGDEVLAEVTHILDNYPALEYGYVVLSIKLLE
ncbi:DUF3850 domain-containing protein [Nostoc sp.]|uniref:DUF3850 domain-containing protein n=1 Tax=Nostoc sp. TaxID=1180 RepID=UPI002FF57A5C